MRTEGVFFTLPKKRVSPFTIWRALGSVFGVVFTEVGYDLRDLTVGVCLSGENGEARVQGWGYGFTLYLNLLPGFYVSLRWRHLPWAMVWSNFRWWRSERQGCDYLVQP